MLVLTSVHLEQEQKERLAQLAKRRSAATGRRVTSAELLRQAVDIFLTFDLSQIEQTAVDYRATAAQQTTASAETST
jgi:predicted DNA-binding protein